MTALDAASPGARTAAGQRPHVVVVGGGLAGIAAAVALCDGGARVTLVEARPRLGGATCSFTRGDLTVDNGQHIFLRCCSAYRGLLDRLGVTSSTAIQDRFDIRVLSPTGAARLRRRALPVPLHLAPALATYPLLSPAERAGAVRAALAFRRLDPADPETDTHRLGDWLAAHGQGPRARRMLWDLFIVSALNIAGDDASLALAAMVIKTALLGAPGAADIGVPTVPLGVLHGQSAAALLGRLGATVLTGAKATLIATADGGSGLRVRVGPAPRADADAAEGEAVAATRPDGETPQGSQVAAPAEARNRAAGAVEPGGEAGQQDSRARQAAGMHGGHGDGYRQEMSGEKYREAIFLPGTPAALAREAVAERHFDADGVVLAVPPEQAARLLPAAAAGPPGTAADPASWARLGASPIVNVHVVYDRPVTALRFAAGAGTQVQWIFDRTEISGCRHGQYLAVSLSAADAYAGQKTQVLRSQFLPALEQLLPAAAAARVIDFFVTRERRATFRQGPGTAAFRPAAATRLGALVLAGAWTNTGWPDTMEGAVRSGLEAARTLLVSLGAKR